MKPISEQRPNFVQFDNLDAWLDSFRTRVGASEVAAILGHGYADHNEFTTWESKVNPTERDTDEPEPMHFLIGKELEPALRRLFEKITGIGCNTPPDNSVVYDPDRPWLGASLDGWGFDESRNFPIELKNVHPRMSRDWDDNAIPLKYAIQVQIQMHCCGSDVGFLFGLCGTDTTFVREIPRNQPFIDAALIKLDEFWRMVEEETPPSVDHSQSTANALARLYPQDDGTGIALPDGSTQWAEALELAKAQIKGWEQVKREASNRIKNCIGDHAYGVFDDGSGYSWKAQTRVLKPRLEETTSTVRVLRAVKRTPKAMTVQPSFGVLPFEPVALPGENENGKPESTDDD